MSAPRQEREREHDRDEEDKAREKMGTPSRSFSIPWATKFTADDAQMLAFATNDVKQLDKDNQWRWHNVASFLAESYSCFDAHLESIFQGFKSTAWNFSGRCILCQRAHSSNEWCLINTPGFPHTTLARCHKTGERRLIQRLPF